MTARGLVGMVACACAGVAILHCSLATSFDGLTGAALEDASASADAGAPFCATRATSVALCNDFDSNDASLSALSPNTDNGTLALDDAIYLSPPRSLHVHENALDGGSSSITVSETTNKTPSVVRVGFSVRIDAMSATDDDADQLLSIDVTSSNHLQLVASTDGVQLIEADEPSDTGRFHGFKTYSLVDGAWHSVEEDKPSKGGG